MPRIQIRLISLFFCGILSLNDVNAKECRYTLEKLRTSSKDGLVAHGAKSLTLDFCISGIKCMGWANNPYFEVMVPSRCNRLDSGYVVCRWDIPVSMKILYSQNGNKIRLKVIDVREKLELVTGYATQNRGITKKDFLAVIQVSGKCP